MNCLGATGIIGQAQWAHLPGKSLLEGALRALEPHYPTFKRYRLIGALPTYLPQIRQALLPQADGLRRMQSFDAMVLSDSLRDSLYGTDLHAVWRDKQHKEQVYRAIVEESWSENPVRMAQALVINTWLTGNALLSQDKVTMAHSLEARVPFFDPALFALAARLPTPLLMKGNKHILREAMRPYLPQFALERPKKPFHTPIRGWFETSLRGEIEGVLRDGSTLASRLFKPAALNTLLNSHFSGQQRQEEMIFRLLNLELWHKAFMSSEKGSTHASAPAS
jgi:asparagine synthase (glutamine-hydrolysing)